MKVKILVVDDDEALRTMVAMALTLNRDPAFEIQQASSHETALELVDKFEPDVVLMDLSMPGPDGDVTTREILKRHPQAKVLAHTGHRDQSAITRMLVAGACGYVVKGGEVLKIVELVRDAYLGQRPIDPAAMPGLMESIVERAREVEERNAELAKVNKRLAESHQQAILALAQALRSRDVDTSTHVDRVEHYCTCLAKELGMSEGEIEDVRYAAIFHDIGKLGVPDKILQGTGKLSKAQWTKVKDHTKEGEKILKPIDWLKDASKSVRAHHENWDGSGYPDGLKRNEIPLGGRIIRICDTFDAMTSGRKYQQAYSTEEAINQLREGADKLYDPRMVQAMIKVISKEQK